MKYSCNSDYNSFHFAHQIISCVPFVRFIGSRHCFCGRPTRSIAAGETYIFATVSIKNALLLMQLFSRANVNRSPANFLLADFVLRDPSG